MSDQAKASLFFGGALLIGVGATWFAVAMLLSFTNALTSRAPLIALEPRDPGVVGLGLTFLAFAAIPLVPGREIGPRKRGKRRARTPKVDEPAICLVNAMVGLVIFAVAPMLVVPVAQAAATRRGYVRCESPDDERHAPMRWVRRLPGLPLGRCPTSWRDTHGG